VSFPLPDVNTRIITRRLYLHPFGLGDAAWYAAMSLKNQPHLARFESGNAVMSILCEADAESTMQAFMADWAAGKAFFLGAFTQADEGFVAQIYVGVANPELPEFEVGYFADAGNEGQGYVSEAVAGVLPFLFQTLGAHRVRIECDETNERSARVAERCGFVREGHIRENHLWPDGSITGTLHFGLLASEFRP
jgi:[ribosomal protein S5]-alanine N-acetyltransferase